LTTKLDLVYFDEELALVFKMIDEINNMKADKPNSTALASSTAQ
jgi:hypothetical protein